MGSHFSDTSSKLFSLELITYWIASIEEQKGKVI